MPEDCYARVKTAAAQAGGLLVLIVFSCSGASARLQIAPVIQTITVPGGGTGRFQLAVGNRSEDTLPCTMMIRNLLVSPTGLTDGTTEPTPRGCAEWIALESQQFELAPGTSRRVRGVVRVPRMAGAYYALIGCQASPGSTPAGSETGAVIRFGEQVNAVLMVVVTGARLSSVIEPRSLTLEVPTGGNDSSGEAGWRCSVLVENTGNMHAVATGQLRLANQHGRVIAETPLRAGMGFVLPGFPRLFTAQGGQRLPDGVYLAWADFSIGEGEQRRIVARATATFSVLAGTVTRGEPTAEMLEAIKARSCGFVVEPARLEISVSPGGTRSVPVSIINMSDQALELVASALDWDKDAEGNVRFVRERPSHRRSCAESVSTFPQVTRVAPRGKATVRVAVSLPREATGEYYAALIMHPVGTEVSEDQTVLLQESTLVSAVAQRTQQPAAEVAVFTVARLQSGAYEFQVTLRNTGNVRVSSAGRITVYDAEGTMVGDSVPIGAGDLSVLPGGECRLTGSWPLILEPGTYAAAATFDLTLSQAVSARLQFSPAGLPIPEGQEQPLGSETAPTGEPSATLETQAQSGTVAP